MIDSDSVALIVTGVVLSILIISFYFADKNDLQLDLKMAEQGYCQTLISHTILWQKCENPK